jgi:hypothetical protein
MGWGALVLRRWRGYAFLVSAAAVSLACWLGLLLFSAHHTVGGPFPAALSAPLALPGQAPAADADKDAHGRDGDLADALLPSPVSPLPEGQDISSTLATDERGGQLDLSNSNAESLPVQLSVHDDVSDTPAQELAMPELEPAVSGGAVIARDEAAGEEGSPQQQQLEKQQLRDALYRQRKLRLPDSVRDEVERVASALEAVGRTKLANIFRKCFVSTLETTTLLMPNGHTHVFTGTLGLSPMWRAVL